ncbi:hypothetical protein THASP1DRAFT_32633 [Thamnocephalis sphaerospora]|uniref:Uncharacterized protein n=1 Tax=Thamnocephalis sphaerospora TaxID=78915 RepID=A0A4P9XIK2_9FUNG|nr:hypothetical protein THASP1DRAFT_32633 [Thamnocephalis sphaerospora]|eukprot:RKP05528.1 hypothetical protein THASP1DRAFT_32633 [Thamnocephalis sphaerospora]
MVRVRYVRAGIYSPGIICNTSSLGKDLEPHTANVESFSLHPAFREPSSDHLHRKLDCPKPILPIHTTSAATSCFDADDIVNDLHGLSSPSTLSLACNTCTHAVYAADTLYCDDQLVSPLSSIISSLTPLSTPSSLSLQSTIDHDVPLKLRNYSQRSSHYLGRSIQHDTPTTGYVLEPTLERSQLNDGDNLEGLFSDVFASW